MTYKSTWKTIAKPHVRKHVPRCKNIRAYTLGNSFSGEPVTGFTDFTLDNGKMRVDALNKRGHLRMHSNTWYEFDYE